LRPDTPEEGEERPLRPGETPGQLSEHLKAIALEAGLVNMKRPERRPNSLKAMQATVHARAEGKGTQLRDALYVAYWEEGKDIGQLDALEEIVEAQGLEWAPIAEALAKNRHLDTVLEEYQEGHDNGFDGIPAFIIGDVKFTGAHPMEVFRKVAERAKGLLEDDPEAFNRVRKIL
jgi:predicted DsbA family dithiol-disulfide isomerase